MANKETMGCDALTHANPWLAFVDHCNAAKGMDEDALYKHIKGIPDEPCQVRAGRQMA